MYLSFRSVLNRYVLKSNQMTDGPSLSDNQMALPVFPQFEPLKLEYKQPIEAITSKFEPYSDFNFTNLWAWDIDGSSLVSTLNNNLVYRLTDYDNGDIRFYTFLGDSDLDKTAHTLIAHSKALNDCPDLMFVPETVALGIRDKKLEIKEERHNFDYILSVDELVQLKASTYRGKKNLLNRFKNKYGDTVDYKNIDLTNETELTEVKSLFQQWQASRNKGKGDVEDELAATNRVLKNVNELEVKACGVFINSKLTGYTIYELPNLTTAVIHFDKADVNHKGIFEFMKQSFAANLAKLGVDYINYQQDLGIEGLRRAKESWHPVKFLKKYTVSYKN